MRLLLLTTLLALTAALVACGGDGGQVDLFGDIFGVAFKFGTDSDNVWPATPADFDAMDDLCRSVYSISRKGEYGALTELGLPAFVLDRGGHRNVKVMNLMAFGQYDEPKGTYCPSVVF